MKNFESWILTYLLNSLWQVALVFVAAAAAARLLRRTGPRMEHRVWVIALLLEVVLPACDLPVAAFWRSLYSFALWFSHGVPATTQIRVAIGPAIVMRGGALHLPPTLLAAIAVLYACSLLYFAGRLAWGLWQTHRMLRASQPVTLTGDAALSWTRHAAQASLGAVEIATSPLLSSPVTIALRRRVLLVPPSFFQSVSSGDLDAVFAHELAHIRRHDFLKNLVYGLVSLPIAWHPLLWLTRSRLAESREMVCDSIAAQAVAGPERYARSLLRMASLLSAHTPDRTLHAIGIFDAHTFERRIMKLTRNAVEVRGARRIVIVAACTVVALATCVSALALHMNLNTPEETAPAKPNRIHVKIDNLKILTRVAPVYPAQAKIDKDTVNGKVALAVVIGKDGAPQNIRVAESLRSDYDESALDAVKQWRWQPYLLNGEPIEVETTINIIYSIGE